MIKGFISYAHSDHAAYEDLRLHLKPIEKAYDIEFWADRRIRPGDYWSSKIQQAIADASIHVLLVTPHFFASDYIFDHELPAINAKYAAGDLVLPIIVKRCCWAQWLGPLQAAPMNRQGRLQPVSEWRPKENGYDTAREQITPAIEALAGIRPKALDWKRP